MSPTIVRCTAAWFACALGIITPALAAPAVSEPATASAIAVAAPAPSTTVTQQLAAKLPELVLNKVLLDEAVRQLYAATQANIVIDWRSLKPAGVTQKTRVSATLRDVPFAEAIDTLLTDAAAGKLTYLASGDVIWILSKDAVARKTVALDGWAKRQVVNPAVTKLLDGRIPEMRAESIPFSDMIDALRDLTGANIVVDWNALQAAGVKRNAPTTVRLRDVKVADILLIVLESVPAEKPLRLTVADGVIHFEVATE